MTNWFSHVKNEIANCGLRSLRLNTGKSHLTICNSLLPARRVIGPLCLGALWLFVSGPQFARGDETVDQAAAQEESLLVATREAPTDERATNPTAEQPADGDTLEPTSQTSERTPELAATYDDASAADFGAGLTNIADSQQKLSANAPQRRDPTVQRDPLALEPVKFRGLAVGKSTKQELITTWGEPSRSAATADGAVLTYDVHPFQAVEVLISPGDVVSAVKVALSAPLDATRLAKQLSLDDVEPAIARDDKEQPLGQAFPERGVLFIYHASSADAVVDDGQSPATVSHVVIHPVEAHAFAMRAENHLHGPYEQNISDLKAAIALDPEFAHAHWLLAKIYLATGQADSADAAAAQACELDPNNAAYQLCRGQTQELLGEYDKAVLTVRAMLDHEELAQIDRAQAMHQMARLASLGDVEIASKTITFHTRAIEIADALATSTNFKERRAAKQLLVEAHLAVAEEIARQPYNNKVENLGIWVGRASGLAEDYITNDGGSIELRLLVAQRALAALAGFRPTLDPAPWVTEAEEAAGALAAQSDDELWQARVKWELGIAYLNALRVDHVRRETVTALRYGHRAVEQFAIGAATRQAVHSSEQLIGQLYFQMGAVHAVHQLDHTKAVQWYNKAEPLLTGARPVSELYAPRREGEMLVSMGVSHWQLGEQDRALTLTRSGVNLVELAVEDGILAKNALAVPYGNLANMYRQMGEDVNAARYAQLAKTVAAKTPKQPPHAVRGNVNRPNAAAVHTAQQSQPAAAALR